MENIVYGTAVTPEEYNRLRLAVGWYELSPRQARDGLAHTPFVACARVDGVCVAMGRALFDFGYTVYLGDVVVDPLGRGRGSAAESWRTSARRCWTPPTPGTR